MKELCTAAVCAKCVGCVDEDELIPRWSSALSSRTITVELSKTLTFHMLEALAQPRPNHWARVWPTSVAVSRWLLSQASDTLPSRATELGCGVGLVSMTLAHLGIVTEGTDREPLALTFALENAARNRVPGFSASLLAWGDDVGVSTTLLLASDIVYDDTAPARLFSVIQSGGLLAPGGRLVLGVPAARTELLDDLVMLLRVADYAHQQQTCTVAWEGRDEHIDVHVLTRPH